MSPLLQPIAWRVDALCYALRHIHGEWPEPCPWWYVAALLHIAAGMP